MDFPIGRKWEQEETVTQDKTAKAVGSGLVEVYATPMMVLLMENTAAACVQAFLESDQATVGTKVDVEHCAATPVGGKVRCVAELVEADGRRLVFQVDAYDEAGRIGGGRHERFVVRTEPFLAKAQTRRAPV